MTPLLLLAAYKGERAAASGEVESTGVCISPGNSAFSLGVVLRLLFQSSDDKWAYVEGVKGGHRGVDEGLNRGYGG